MYPHKCTLKNLKKKYQEKWENAYLIVKNARASRTLRQALNPGQSYIAHFPHPTLVYYVGKNLSTNFCTTLWPNPGSASVNFCFGCWTSNEIYMSSSRDPWFVVGWWISCLNWCVRMSKRCQVVKKYQIVKKIWKCPKDVKMLKRCQIAKIMSKSQFTNIGNFLPFLGAL